MKARKREALEARKQAAKAQRSAAPNARQEEARLARDAAFTAQFLANWRRTRARRAGAQQVVTGED